jgi:hypothetical protein
MLHESVLGFTAVRVLAVAVALLSALSPVQSTPTDAVQRLLVGNWKLVKYEVFAQNGETRPGTFDIGRLMYDERGEMSAHLMRSGGPKEAPTTEAARAAAYQAYLSYFGPYTIDVDKATIVHHVVGSSFPHWIGTEQLRHYVLSPDGNGLTLSLKTGDRSRKR